MDKLIVRGLELHAHHGYYEEERRDGRTFVVDMDAWLRPLDAGKTDLLEHALDYRDIAGVAVSVMEGDSRHLIESLAESIAAGVLRECQPVSRVRVQIRKRATGVPGDPEFVGVEIIRER